VRGLRLVSQLGLEPDAETLPRCAAEAASVALVSGERVGGGVGADGMGNSRSCCSGRQPARHCRLARDTGVLTALLPEFEPAIGFEQSSERQPPARRAHLRSRASGGDADAPLAVRLGALFHDLGKPGSNGKHPERGAKLTAAAMRRLRYPTRLRTYVTRLVRACLCARGRRRALRAAFASGDELAFDLVGAWRG
jgi:tRNA nucleotidyltransferase/poly(A) polymerase